MQHINRLFSEDDRTAVNRAIQQAESGTSAEIVPVIAASSGRYDRPEDIVGLWTALLGLVLVWVIYPLPDARPESWTDAAPAWHLAALAAAVVVGFVVGAIVGTKVDGLRRLFTPKRQMRAEVMSRARAVFFDQRVHRTTGSSGVLLYISLFERMTAVITDDIVLQHLGQERIDSICTEFTQHLRTGSPIVALCETSFSVGQHLAHLLPKAANDVNELPDALVLIN